MKPCNLFSLKFLALAIVLIGVSATPSLATVDTIYFGGATKTFRPATLNVTVGDTIFWSGYFGPADPYHQLQSEIIPSGAAEFGPITTGHTFTYIVKVAGVYNYQCLNHCCGVLGNMMGNFTAVDANVPSTPNPIVDLGANFPNPSSGSTVFTYTLASPSQVSLNIFDLNGKVLKQIVNEYQNSGSYEVAFDASSLANGTYTYQLRAGEAILARQMVIMK
ncbi:MAG: T9SS type A sorting domain-containing protein [Candidatus Kapaibacterium sp.]